MRQVILFSHDYDVSAADGNLMRLGHLIFLAIRHLDQKRDPFFDRYFNLAARHARLGTK